MLPRTIWEIKRWLLNPKRKDFPVDGDFLTGDFFRSLAHHVFDDHGLTFLPSQVKDNELIFIKAYTPLVDYFFRKILPRIQVPIRLVTHNEDRSFPEEYSEYLASPKLSRWYSTNVSHHHPKMVALPIGILNHRASSRPAEILRNLLVKPPEKKLPLAYLNFHIGGAEERAGYREKRQAIYDQFKHQPWITASSRVSTEDYLAAIQSHAFVISPPGHGPDCYRHWEAMYLGTVPIVERSTSMDSFDGFPMLVVDHWSDVTADLLERSLDRFQKRPFDRKQLFQPYWRARLMPCRC